MENSFNIINNAVTKAGLQEVIASSEQNNWYQIAQDVIVEDGRVLAGRFTFAESMQRLAGRIVSLGMKQDVIAVNTAENGSTTL